MSPLTPGGPASGVMTPVTPGKSNDHQVYAKQGEWVLMPKNHMIVVVGMFTRVLTAVFSVFLHLPLPAYL